MAIVSFALLAIIGLMPAALADVNEAERRAAEARILQSLAAEYELKSWAEVKDTTASGNVYFDSRGVRVKSLTKDAQYAARIDIMPPPADGTSGGGAGDLSLPGDAPGSSSPYLRRLRVSITDQPRNPMAFAGIRNSRLHHEHALILVNREPDSPTPALP